MNASNKYSLPVPRSALERMDRTSSPAHFGKLKNAIDLVVTKNTPVLAAADGVVTFVKADHLDVGSSTVRPGQYVRKGQVLGRVGLSGYTYLPHLHFQVFNITGPNIWTDFRNQGI
jgi:murein DD-endopeptidase MepM/ murein hydrolase activator NlpD